MKVLITGGAGFLGRHFTNKLLSLDHEVTSVDNLTTSGGGMKPTAEVCKNKHFSFVLADCVDFFRDSREKFDLVIHLAGLIGGREVIENQQLFLTQNLIIDCELFKWASLTKPKNLILFSSSAVYPVHLQSADKINQLKESDFDVNFLNGIPDLTYGWCKQNLEFLAKIYSDQLGLKCIIYRPFSGYGEDQSLSYPIPSLCKRALLLKPNEPFKVWGSGKQSRDFIYIEDIVDAVLNTYSIVPNGIAINLCSGEATSFLKIAEEIKSILNIDNEVVAEPEKPSGVFSRYGDNSFLTKFGFNPKVSLNEGLRRTLQYLS